MPHTRSCAVVLIGAASLALLWALPGRGTLVPPTPLPTTADPAATQLLNQALAALDPAERPFLETNVWQRVRLPHLEYESEGRFVLGTEHRYRMEFHTRIGKHKGSLLQVCDGSSLWQGTRPCAGPWTEVRRIQLEKSATGPVMPTDLWAHGFTFSGVRPLLTSLRGRLLWVRQEKTTLQNDDCLLLTGVWPPRLATVLAPADKPWPEDLPNQCRLWLDSRTLWPRRIEWLSAGNSPRRLVEMELRVPQFLPAMSPERCHAEFTFEPGNSKVVDLSEPGSRNPSWQQTKMEATVF